MVEHQMWWVEEKHDHPLRQILKRNDLIEKFRELGLTVEGLQVIDPQELRRLLRSDRDTEDAIRAAKRFPSVSVKAGYQPISPTILQVLVDLKFSFEWDSGQDSEQFWLFVEDSNGGAMYHAQEISVDRHVSLIGLHLEILVPKARSFRVSIVSVRLLGLSDHQILTVRGTDTAGIVKYETKDLGIRLPVSVIGEHRVATCFPFQTFNSVQSQLFFPAFRTDDSILLCSPPTTGKTTVAELAMFHLFTQNPTGKAVYLSPFKAVLAERFWSWRQVFGDRVAEVSSDYALESSSLTRARLVISTPERWDSFSRSAFGKEILLTVSLLIIDDLHLLGQPRGHVVEAIIDRMRSGRLRIFGLSSCVSNPIDLAQFLQIPRSSVFNFTLASRTIPLMWFVRGFPGRHYGPRMAAMNKPLSDAISEHSDNKPTLVFVASRRQTRLTALDVIAFANNAGRPFYFQTPDATSASEEVLDRDLRHCLSLGVGLHHSGLNPQDLQIVERLFASGKLRLLVGTPTCAWATRLRGYFVVIKGTEYFDQRTNQYIPYTPFELQQMIAKAGRPGKDDRAIAMILCEESRREFIGSLIDQPFPVESSMSAFVVDHLNAEIASKRILSQDDAISWIDRSYFGLRLNRNPKYYDDIILDSFAKKCMETLIESRCLTSEVISTQAWRIASMFYVSHQTIQTFLTNLQVCQTIPSLLHLICQAHEFEEIPGRRNDSELLVRMRPRFPITNDDPDSPHTKLFLILQYYFKHKRMPQPDFETDLYQVLDTLMRITACLCELCASEKDLFGMINSILIQQMVLQQIWWDEAPLKALLDDASVRRVSARGITNIPQLIMNRRKSDELVDQILVYRLVDRGIIEGSKLRLVLRRINGQFGSPVISNIRKDRQFVYVIVGSPTERSLIYHRRVELTRDQIEVVVAIRGQFNPDWWIYLMSDSYLGIYQMYPIGEVSGLKQATAVRSQRRSAPEEPARPPKKKPRKKQQPGREPELLPTQAEQSGEARPKTAGQGVQRQPRTKKQQPARGPERLPRQVEPDAAGPDAQRQPALPSGGGKRRRTPQSDRFTWTPDQDKENGE
jgi:activating signal cointegrator complex subunit 3